MDEDAIGSELIAVLQANGIDVRVIELTRELPGVRSGVATLKGQTMLFLDAGLPALDRIAVIARAVAGLDLDNVYLSPAAREMVEQV